VVGSNLTKTYLYWYTRAVFDNEWKYVKISVFAETSQPHDYAKVEEQLLPFGKAITEHWQPIQSSSTMAIAVTRDRPLLIILALSLPSFILVSTATRKWKDKRLNGKIYNRLFGDDKLIIQAVYGAAKEGKSTTDAVGFKYQELSGKPIQNSELSERLNYAEEAGLIKQFIANDNDNPILVWKPNFKLKG